MLDSYCIIKICFKSIDEVRYFVSLMTNEKLFAYAHVTRIGTYKLRLDDEEIVGYIADENALGYPSQDRQDDILLEVYTSERLASKIKIMAEKEFPENSDSFLTVPILEASLEMRRMIHKLNMYHMYEENTSGLLEVK